MPFGVHLPGPFTWYPESAGSRLARRNARQRLIREMESQLDQIKTAQLHELMAAEWGTDATLAELAEVARVRRLSPHLAAQRWANTLGLLAEELLPTASACRTRGEFRRAWRARYGHRPRPGERVIFRAVWRHVRASR